MTEFKGTFISWARICFDKGTPKARKRAYNLLSGGLNLITDDEKDDYWCESEELKPEVDEFLELIVNNTLPLYRCKTNQEKEDVDKALNIIENAEKVFKGCGYERSFDQIRKQIECTIEPHTVKR